MKKTYCPKKVYYYIANEEKVYFTLMDKKSWNKDPVIGSATIGRPKEVVERMKMMGCNFVEDPDFKELLVSKGYCCCMSGVPNEKD